MELYATGDSKAFNYHAERAPSELYEMFDNFITALTHSNAYSFDEMPWRWQQAQALLSRQWHQRKLVMGKCPWTGAK